MKQYIVSVRNVAGSSGIGPREVTAKDPADARSAYAAAEQITLVLLERRGYTIWTVEEVTA